VRQGRAQVVHYLHQEIDEKRRQMQQQLDLRDRQLIEASRARAEQLVPFLCSTYSRRYQNRMSGMDNVAERIAC